MDASMRPRRKWRGNRSCTRILAGLRGCFNEAAPEMARKSLECLTLVEWNLRFNEAAPEMARKYGFCREYCQRDDVLQ